MAYLFCSFSKVWIRLQEDINTGPDIRPGIEQVYGESCIGRQKLDFEAYELK